jgi:hypothetical protein
MSRFSAAEDPEVRRAAQAILGRQSLKAVSRQGKYPKFFQFSDSRGNLNKLISKAGAAP